LKKLKKKILVIIQRSNGDVFYSFSLIKALHENYAASKIDLLVNDDTCATAKLIPFVNKIITFSYQKKNNIGWRQDLAIIYSIFKKYDICINLTASDRSVIFALFAGKVVISPVESENKKNWWKKILLTHFYFFDFNRHILLNNLKPLNYLQVNVENIHYSIQTSKECTSKVKAKLESLGVKDFFIFHPSAQYLYKVYPLKLRNTLLSSLDKLGVSIIITGSDNAIDLDIKKQIPLLNNVIDLIGETTLEEYLAISELSLGYIGMDTLNMHIAASQNKRIFAIFGPTNLRMWSPWSNYLKSSAIFNQPIQTYGKITIFQADMPCVACGKAGCNDNFGNSDCLDNISPRLIFDHVNKWYQRERI
jgi:heptosyltransferase III